jgi:hypothetical protein
MVEAVLMWVLVWVDAPEGPRDLHKFLNREACDHVVKKPPKPGHYRCELR